MQLPNRLHGMELEMRREHWATQQIYFKSITFQGLFDNNMMIG